MKAPAFLLAILALLLVGNVKAQTGQHGDGHSERHDWYKELNRPSSTPFGGNFSCCSKLSDDGKTGDCRPMRAKPDGNGGWFAWFNGGWIPVPPHVVLPSHLNKEPIYAHGCLSPDGYWRCFLPAGDGS